MNQRINRTIIVAIISLFLIAGAKGGFAQKFMIGYGVSIYSDIVASKSTSSTGNDIKAFRFNIFSMSLEMKHNLFEFSENLALSIAASPGFGIGAVINNDGVGNVRLPIYAQLDYGKLSTFPNTQDYGVGIGIGYQHDFYNLIRDGSELFSIGTVAARVGFRCGHTTEFALKIGFPKTLRLPFTRTVGIYGNQETYYKNVQINSYQLSFIYYWNY